MWQFNRNKISPPPPHPPTGMTPAAFKQAQDDYVTKYDKLVKHNQLLAAEAFKLAADAGKAVYTWLVLGNTGGLAAIVVLAPIMHESNHVFLQQQFCNALAFGFGAAFAVGVAVIAHFNYASHATYLVMQSRRDDNWLKGTEFNLQPQWRAAMDTWIGRIQDTANSRANFTNVLSVVFVIVSAACWVYGSVSLVMSVGRSVPI